MLRHFSSYSPSGTPAREKPERPVDYSFFACAARFLRYSAQRRFCAVAIRFRVESALPGTQPSVGKSCPAPGKDGAHLLNLIFYLSALVFESLNRRIE